MIILISRFKELKFGVVWNHLLHQEFFSPLYMNVHTFDVDMVSPYCVIRIIILMFNFMSLFIVNFPFFYFVSIITFFLLVMNIVLRVLKYKT